MEMPLPKPDCVIRRGGMGYVNMRRAAKLMAVHHKTVRRWIDGGLIPAMQIGGKGTQVLIAISDLHDFIEKGAIHEE